MLTPTLALATGGAGGSWDCDYGQNPDGSCKSNPYNGGGGGFGGAGAGSNWQECKYTTEVYGKKFEGNSANEVCQSIPHELIVKPSHYPNNNYKSFSHRKLRFSSSYKNTGYCDFIYNHIFGLQTHTSAIIKTDCDNPEPPPTPEPPPAPDTPQDCDPAIQQCDKNGKPLCDCCEKLDTLIGINQKIQSNTAQTNNLLSQTNNHLTSIKSNTAQTNTLLNQTNAKLDTLINILNNKGINVDLSRIHQQLDTLIAKKVDLAPINNKLDALIQAVQDNKYDDSELQAKIDEVTQAIIDKQIDLTPVTERQDETKNILNTTNDKLDEQTTILDDIRDMFDELLGREPPDPNQPKPPDPLDLAEQQYDSNYDPWGAIRGFDIGQNRINASNQCPADKTVTILGGTLTFKMGYFCDFLAMLAPAFLAIAYIMGGIIIVRGSD